MRYLIITILTALVVALGAAVAVASNGNGGLPRGGDNPCPPSYHAEGDACVHNGDGGGNCGQNQSDNGGDHGYGHEGQCGEETETTPTDTTPTTPEPPVTPPHDCVYTGAGKDGQEGNDDCAPLEQPSPATPALCVPEVKTVVVNTTTPGKVQVKTKIVYRTKVKTKIVVKTRVIVKTVKVYVPGVHPKGVEGSG